MSTCSRFFMSIAMIASAMMVAASASAESTVLAGMFDGSDPTMASFGSCGGAAAKYHQVPFEVSEDGQYQEGWIQSFGSTVRVYEGGFDPEQPEQNVMPIIGIGWFGGYALSAETDYVLVIQDDCGLAEDSWAAAFIGPGSFISDAAVELPTFSRGVLSDTDPTMPTHCGTTRGPWGWGVVDDASFQQSEPIQVSREGTYHYSSVQIQDGAWVCLSIYSAPVDPLNPSANRVAMLDGNDLTVELEQGKDYYFVTQWNGGEFDDDAANSSGEFLHILIPPAPLRINQGMADSWHNPDNPGQGFFLTVYEKLNQVFLGWFTYASETPSSDEFGHRWLTALGNFEGSSAELAIEWTAGGSFDAATPVPERHIDGTIDLEFTDCNSGQVTYNWGGSGGAPAASGVIPIQRLANDSVALCEALYAGPGMPGPL